MAGYLWLPGAADQFHNRLRGHGALILDTAPALLTGHLINRYQQIKNLGSL